MFNVKTLNKIAQPGLEVLRTAGATVGDEVAAPNGILVRSANMHEYEFNSELVAIARAGAGTNNIPIDRCTQEGICVFNTPGANAEAVKELCICAILMASRDIVGGVQWVKSIAGEGDNVPKLVEKGKSAFVGPEITGKTLGVVGLGAVGAKIANAAIGLGMHVYGYDPFLSVDAAWRLSGEVKHALDLDTIYKNCDYITIHVPHMPATHHMINAEAFSKMKDGVRLINLARGELVDDQAVAQALESGKLARYVTDFPNAVTANLDNVIALPHLGASTPESEEKCAVMAAQQLLDYLTNGNIRNSVNLPAVQLDRAGTARLCVVHKNVPGIINKCMELISAEKLNVEHMINKARGEVAYTIVDTDKALPAELAEAIRNMEEVMGVRVL